MPIIFNVPLEVFLIKPCVKLKLLNDPKTFPWRVADPVPENNTQATGALAPENLTFAYNVELSFSTKPPVELYTLSQVTLPLICTEKEFAYASSPIVGTLVADILPASNDQIDALLKSPLDLANLLAIIKLV